MSLHTKVSGVLNTVTTSWVKVSGVWKTAQVYVKVAGVWKNVSGVVFQFSLLSPKYYFEITATDTLIYWDDSEEGGGFHPDELLTDSLGRKYFVESIYRYTAGKLMSGSTYYSIYKTLAGTEPLPEV